MMDQIEMGPHGKHQLLNKKESSKSLYQVESSEKTNILKNSRIENFLLFEIG